MKKGFWQDSVKHDENYGDSFKNSKFFSYYIREDVLKTYIQPMYQKTGGMCDMYEFGVYTGGTLNSLISQLNNNSIFVNNVYGFDSFQGLPKEEQGKDIEGKHWLEGGFSACDAIKEWDWEKLKQKIIRNIGSDKVILIKGYYEDILNLNLIQQYAFKPALFVHIDVDLYKSTKEVLNWLFSNRLVVPGTVIRYDDVFYVPETTGEILAHNEMCKLYNVECNRLYKDYFVVSKI